MHSFDSNSSNVPAFLIKLWKLVEDADTNDLIAWNDNGSSFIIRDQTRFAKELLPQYFKHSNMASFIRQLNMYGFRKVLNYEKSGLKCENDEMEFQHTFFLRGQGAHLELIKRKIPNAKVAEPCVKSNAKDILTDLTSIREKQENMDNMLLKMKQENELLWRELTSMRQKHKAQEQIIQKVIQFLVSIVQRSNQNIGVQRKMPRMLRDSPRNKGKQAQVSTRTIDVLRKKGPDCFITQNKATSPVGPVIHEVIDLDHEEVLPDTPAASDPSPPQSSSDEIENECPLNSSINSPINTLTTMEPLSILEPLEPRIPALTSDDEFSDEQVLGIPLDFTSGIIPVSDVSQKDAAFNDSSSLNLIAVKSGSTTNSNGNATTNVISEFKPHQQIKEEFALPCNFDLSSDNVLIYSPPSSVKMDDIITSEPLLTPDIPTIHIMSPGPNFDRDSETQGVKKDAMSKAISIQNEHDYQLALSDSNLMKPNTLTKNSLSNHVLNVEEELNWLQDQIQSNAWNIDASKLLGLFSADDMANNESLVTQFANESIVKQERNDIVGNELVQFTPHLLDVGLDIENSQLLDGLASGSAVSNVETLAEALAESNDQIAASEAAEFLLDTKTSPKCSLSSRRSKAPKSQKIKRRKLK